MLTLKNLGEGTLDFNIFFFFVFSNLAVTTSSDLVGLSC